MSAKSHVKPSHVISHTARHISSVASSTPRHLADYWLGPTRPGPPGFDPWALIVDFDQDTLTLNFIDFDFYVNIWPEVKILERAYPA